MNTTQSLAALAALAQGTRLDVFRLLVEHEPEGLAAGDVARRLAIPATTMSTHLSVLRRAGLVLAERRSRHVVYRASIEHVRALADFLLEHCCGGQPDLCSPRPATACSP